jgi:hypothetical protein
MLVVSCCYHHAQERLKSKKSIILHPNFVLCLRSGCKARSPAKADDYHCGSAAGFKVSNYSTSVIKTRGSVLGYLGSGFVTDDAIGQKMGHPAKTYPRVLAGCEYLLEENRDSGHLYMEPADFLKKLQKLLNKGKEKPDRFTETELAPLVRQALDGSKNITVANGSIYLTQDFNNERTFAVLMAERLAAEARTESNVIPIKSISGHGIQLSDEQETAVLTALYRNTCIISGGPVTGKTTVSCTGAARASFCARLPAAPPAVWRRQPDMRRSPSTAPLCSVRMGIAFPARRRTMT